LVSVPLAAGTRESVQGGRDTLAPGNVEAVPGGGSAPLRSVVVTTGRLAVHDQAMVLEDSIELTIVLGAFSVLRYGRPEADGRQRSGSIAEL
jgi:hypothetical protein